jgi:hypothetical protein
MQKSMSLEYVPASEPLHIPLNQLFLNFARCNSGRIHSFDSKRQSVHCQLGGVRGIRSPSILGCCVPKTALREALQLIE